MFCKHSKNKRKFMSEGGIVREPMVSMVNNLYKPKTLAELRAMCVATGVNPSPQPLRPALVEVKDQDPMNAFPVRVDGDVFQDLRTAREISQVLDKTTEGVRKIVQDFLDQAPLDGEGQNE